MPGRGITAHNTMSRSYLILSMAVTLVSCSPVHHVPVPEFYGHGEGQKPWTGPPAPLNPDGTVAFTPEFHEVASLHHQMHAEEYKRLQETAEYAKAHPDLTSLPGKSDSYDDGSYRHQSDERQYHQGRRYRRSLHSYGHGQIKHLIPAPLNHDGTVAYTEEFAATAAHLRAAHKSNYAHQLAILAKQDALAKAAGPDTEESHDENSLVHHNHVEANHGYSGNFESHGKYHGPPAPLNHDGTVAHTAEYKAIAASHASVRHGRRRRSAYHGESLYHGPPAPLNHDGTVAETPEVAHLSAEHHAAHAHQLALLAKQEAKALAAGPDKEHYGDEEYEHSSGSYQSYTEPSEEYHHQEPSHYSSLSYGAWDHGAGEHGGAPWHGPPAPLNHDGTVAQTPEFLAIAAKHAAATHHHF